MSRISLRRMNPYSFLHNITKSHPLSLEGFVSKGQYQDASIACILRLSPSSDHSSFASVEAVMDHMHLAQEMEEDENEDEGEGGGGGTNKPGVGLEILFMKRAMRPGDQWGGHVAWPGGFLTAGEEAVTGVRREVLEELGVDLDEGISEATGIEEDGEDQSGKKYTHLGGMQSTRFGPSHKSLRPHVFLKMDSVEPSFILEETEADAVMWIDINHFLHRTCPSKLDTHTVYAKDILPALQTTGQNKLRTFVTGKSRDLVLLAARFLGFDQWHFPCVRLPPLDVKACTDKYPQKEDWVIWGLTFNTLRRLLRHANGNQEYLSVATPYRTENSIFNAFVAYFYQYYSKRYSAFCERISEQGESEQTTITTTNPTPNPDTDPNLHRKILLSSFGGLAGVYGVSAAAGIGIYSVSTALISSAIHNF